MQYKDLTPYEGFIPRAISNVLNVGWLGQDGEFETGPVPAGLVEKLSEVLVSNGIFESRVHQLRSRWPNPCHICGRDEFAKPYIGLCEMWIPSTQRDLYFAAPSLIIHFIEHHGYRPPQIFIDAVFQLNLDEAFSAERLWYEIIEVLKAEAKLAK